MLTLADVRRWDTGALEAALRTLGRGRDALVDLDDEMATTRPTEADWEGVAADGARRRHEQLAEQLRRLAAGATRARLAVATAADAIEVLQTDLHHAEQDAIGSGFSLDPDGTVTDRRQVVVAADQAAAYQQQRAGVQQQILGRLQQILDRAAVIDADLNTALARSADPTVDDGNATTIADAGRSALGDTPLQTPPEDGTPQQNMEWWNHLTPASQERLLLDDPARIGNLDGVPAGVRDEANRARLPDETARIDAGLRAADERLKADLLRPIPPGPEGDVARIRRVALQGEVDTLTEQKAALASVQQATARPDRQLLLLDVDGHAAPRAAVASGDIDTARHVAVFTPGFTSKVSSSLKGYTDQMDTMRTTAQRLDKRGGGDPSVAAVTWMGYDIPQLDTIPNPARSVALPLAAANGGADLAHFYDGINTSRPGDDPHLTALGHSYGSTTTGYALQDTTTPVDDAVLFGSPGASTGDVSDLHVPPGHVNVIEARDDPVADLGSFGGDANQLDGITPLASHSAADPSGNGPELLESVGHSEYLTEGTTSQHNIATTVAGRPDQQVAGTDNGAGDYGRYALGVAASRFWPIP